MLEAICVMVVDVQAMDMRKKKKLINPL